MHGSAPVDPSIGVLGQLLCCPIDATSVTIDDVSVACERGHRFPCVDGIPILLNPTLRPTHAQIFSATWRQVEAVPPPMSFDEAYEYAMSALALTCGRFYLHKRERFDALPIPRLLIPPGHGYLLDVGCGWGRWGIAALQKGYTVVGIDPSLHSVRAARELTKQAHVPAVFVVGDARCLPFKPSSFDLVHSYAVFLHFPKHETRAGVAEIGRVLRPGGEAFVQLPNAYGVHNAFVLMSRWFRGSPDEGDFSTRYWTRREMRTLFEASVGPCSLVPEGFGYTSAGGIPQNGLSCFPMHTRMALTASERLRQLARYLPFMAGWADSMYVHARREIR